MQAKSYPMKKYLILFILISVSLFTSAQNPIFVQDSLKLISSQFKFTEGASVDQYGNVFFTDQPNDKIWKYDTDGKLSLYMDKSGRANGTFFDKKGNLIVCADENNQIWSIDKSKKITVLFNDFKGKKVNGPNDIWLDAKGGIYFTDPYYQRDYWKRKSPEIKEQRVYYLPKGKKDEQEKVESAAVREVKEECGIKKLTLGDFITKSYHCYNMENVKVLKITHWFNMLIESDTEFKPQGEENITEVKWFNQKDLDIEKLDTYNSIREILNFAFAQNKETAKAK